MLALTMLGCGGTSAGSSSTSASTESSPQPDSSVAPASTRPAQSADVQAISNQVLALDPRVPGDVNLFTSQFNPGAVDGLYPSGSAMEPGSTPALTEEEVRHQLSSFLTTWHGDDAKESAALALFDDTLVKLMVPEPDNRAAFVCLAGTIWEPLIDYYLHSDRFNPSRYGGLPITVMARSSLVGEKMTIIFNVRHQGESFIRKIPQWVHEIGHHDGPNSGDEEAVQHSVTAMAWAQVLTASPAVAYENTELTRYLNSYLLVFLNSRNKGSPTSQVIASTGTDTAPGSAQSTRDFRAFIGGASGSTPLPPALGEILSGLGVADTSEYSTALV
jgi:hypothetical protein